MKEPDIKKFPTEIFCHPYTEKSKKSKNAIKDQYCSFIGGTCVKPRKSEPSIKIGVCSLGYKGSFAQEYSPVIVCPHRFKEEVVFESLQKLYLKGWGNSLKWVTEVSMGVGGSVDYVAVDICKNGTVEDFFCFEFQAAGTTGSPWQAVLDYKKQGRFSKDVYQYGINWANEFVKTMMQQVYKKGKIIESWNRKLVFVVQNVALDYIRSAVDTSELRSARDSDPIHFCAFQMVWKRNMWVLELNEVASTSLEGINKILGGARGTLYPSVEDFKSNIIKKGRVDGLL
ncbi:MAG: NotI family restriction endonuclease [Thermodesulfobacteriota bacterium]